MFRFSILNLFQCTEKRKPSIVCLGGEYGWQGGADDDEMSRLIDDEDSLIISS